MAMAFILKAILVVLLRLPMAYITTIQQVSMFMAALRSLALKCTTMTIMASTIMIAVPQQ